MLEYRVAEDHVDGMTIQGEAAVAPDGLGFVQAWIGKYGAIHVEANDFLHLPLSSLRLRR